MRRRPSKRSMIKNDNSRFERGAWIVAQVLLTIFACSAAPLVCRATADFSLRIGLPLAFGFVLSQAVWRTFRLGRISVLSTDVLLTMAMALTGAAIGLLLRRYLPVDMRASNSSLIVAALSTMVLLLLLQALFATIARRASIRRRKADATLVVGSGQAAASLIEVVSANASFPFHIVGCVDDEKLADRVAGKKVLGTLDDLPRLIGKLKIRSVIIAIPFAPPELVKRTLNLCMSTPGLDGRPPAVKILPGVMELLNDGARIARIRAVKPEDLLPRDPVKIDVASVAPHLANRVILVTGAGGSIGSELCRQIVGLNPKLLLLLGHGANSLFAIDEELRMKYGFTQTRIVLADVADASRIRHVFSEYRPHVVFHAAAHKHVPIVEANICEAARNNVLGTHVVALAAAAAGTAKFVLLSTDKAVNPTSVMGVTKRMSEIISQSFVNQTGTEFVTVRFGNVLESRGSVIPIFKRQIEHGGPITITHRDMQRYFMTIPEAVSLVLEAMAIGRDGQVLVLDMGKPVNILRLAETLITLSGLTPYSDIAIIETGIRPGEKLYEEILTSHEGMSTTSHERLFIALQERVAYDMLAIGLQTLEKAVRTGETDTILDVLRRFVPSYAAPAHHSTEDDTVALTLPESKVVMTHNGHVSNTEPAVDDSKAASNGVAKHDGQRTKAGKVGG